jgi:hypothetical protein
VLGNIPVVKGAFACRAEQYCEKPCASSCSRERYSSEKQYNGLSRADTISIDADDLEHHLARYQVHDLEHHLVGIQYMEQWQNMKDAADQV